MVPEPVADLSGIGVLVPRPLRERDTLLEKLRAVGCTPWVKPVIELKPIRNSLNGSKLEAALARADAVIFVSSHAVEFCLQALEKEQARMPENPSYFAVGRSTAEKLASIGCDAKYPVSRADSEGLLALPELVEVKGKKIIICRGRGGREKLRQELESRGAMVEYVDLYAREATERNKSDINRLIVDDKVQAVIIHSGEIMETFLACLNGESLKKLMDIVVLVPSQRVGQLPVAQQRWIRKRLVAENALPEGIVDALVRWYTDQKVG